MGKCHRYPPIATYNGFPNVKGYDFCGEWEKEGDKA
jgi:hypothetical protein